MAKGVNTAKSNAQRVRVGDYGSQIVIELTNSENEVVQDLQWIRAYSASQPNITQFIDITDFDVIEGNVYITLPDIPMGQYNIELKDDVGRIYPAEGSIRLNMVQSTKEAVEVYYVNYKDLILDDVTPIIEDYLVSNSDVFRGEKGDAFTWGDLTEEQKEELTGSDGANGINGLSAYELASDNGFVGSETEWLDSLKGKDGEDGERGSDGLDGSDGKDFTYEDFTDEQLENLKLKIVETEFDEDGNTIVSLTDGSSFTVNKGSQGVQGKDGYTPVKGVDYFDGADGKDGEDGYTPIKGVDYFDGKDGVDGKDGTDGLSFDYDSLTDEQKAEIKGNTGKDGYTPVKGVDYFDGTDGKDFVFSDFTTEQLENLKLKIVDTEFDSDGNTLVTFTDDSEITVNRGLKGEQGDKGEDGLHGNTVSLTENEDGTYTLINTDPNSGEEIKRVVLHSGENNGGSEPKEWQTVELPRIHDGQNHYFSTNGDRFTIETQLYKESINFTDTGIILDIDDLTNLSIDDHEYSNHQIVCFAYSEHEFFEGKQYFALPLGFVFAKYEGKKAILIDLNNTIERTPIIWNDDSLITLSYTGYFNFQSM